MDRLTLRSPAKVNLYLRVLGRRPDGYHEIETLFERISWTDEITLERSAPADGVRVVCDHPNVPSDERNVAWRAAQQLLDTAGLRAGLTIRIVKRIPVAGGLGGGSSNAATVLLGLNRWLRLHWSRERLTPIARILGADVPFFLYETPWAIGTERGDRIEPLAVTDRLWQVIVVPPVTKPSTGAVYRALPHPLTPPEPDVKVNASFVQRLATGTPLGLSNYNSLELSQLVVREPLIQEAKRRLREAGAAWVTMSGSGPSVVGVVPSAEVAERLAQRIRTATSWLVHAAQTV